MKEFKKWLDKECDDDRTMYPSSYDDCEDAWKAALKCVRDKMLPNCHESTDIYDFIEDELNET